MSEKVVFLDFDGVLFDSVKEAYLLSRKAYFDIDIKVPIDTMHYSKFRKFRYLITHSWQYFYMLQMIENNIGENEFEQKFYDVVTKSLQAEDFDRNFALARENLLKTDFEYWDSIDEPFEFFKDVARLCDEFPEKFIILTNKKKLPVQNKLKKYKVNNIKLFANEDLLSYNNKAEFIIDYMEKHNLQKSFLVEDSIDNINSCGKYPQIHTLLVDWGYIHPREKGVSRDEILEIIKE